jgi:predicted ATPase
MTGLFTIFCVFGTLINSNENNLLRSLKEKGGSKNSTTIGFNNEKRVNVPFLIEKDYTKRHQKEIEMYQKIKKNNLKNKNMMVPASLFTNNSEQIFSNINNKGNNTNNISETENIEDKNRNTSLLNGKIKIIEKELSNKNNDDIKNEINMK